jgi:hypothetical protein
VNRPYFVWPELLLLLSAGARGGRAEFSWDNVKSDKDREFYLGHSVKAGVGRWQKGARCLAVQQVYPFKSFAGFSSSCTA